MAKAASKRPCCEPWVQGANYFIRTVTLHYTGKLLAVYPNGLLVIGEAAWIADDGRFTQAIKDGTYAEVEPYPDTTEVIIGIGSIVDACQISTPLPRLQK